MTKPHAKPRLVETKPSMVHATRIATVPMDAAAQRDATREFIRAMSAELSALAHKNGLEALALIFEMAREAAEAEAPERPSARS